MNPNREEAYAIGGTVGWGTSEKEVNRGVRLSPLIVMNAPCNGKY